MVKKRTISLSLLFLPILYTFSFGASIELKLRTGILSLESNKIYDFYRQPIEDAAIDSFSNSKTIREITFPFGVQLDYKKDNVRYVASYDIGFNNYGWMFGPKTTSMYNDILLGINWFHVNFMIGYRFEKVDVRETFSYYSYGWHRIDVSGNDYLHNIIFKIEPTLTVKTESNKISTSIIPSLKCLYLLNFNRDVNKITDEDGSVLTFKNKRKYGIEYGLMISFNYRLFD